MWPNITSWTSTNTSASSASRAKTELRRAHDRPPRLPASIWREKAILATGYYDLPNRLNVPGEDLDKVIHYYKEPHPYYNHDVAVIGAKNSAAIAALELYWTGARVTLIHRGDGHSQPRQVLDQAEHREPH